MAALTSAQAVVAGGMTSAAQGLTESRTKAEASEFFAVRQLLEEPVVPLEATSGNAVAVNAGSSALLHKGGHEAWACVLMSLVAGLATTIGAMVVFVLPGGQVTPEQLAFSLALAGGVMVSVTVLEFWIPALLGHANKRVFSVLVYSTLGILAFLGLSALIPEPDMVGVGKREVESEQDLLDRPDTPGEPSRARNRSRSPGNGDAGPPSPEYGTAAPDIVDVEAQSTASASGGAKESGKLSSRKARHWRLAVVMMMSLTAHNFPEGFAVAVSAFESERLGFVVMLAITLHNIPEGIAIAVPVLAATGSRTKALLFSLLSGAAEPLGAATSILVLKYLGDISEASMENLLCTVGGVMTAVAVKELFPEAWAQQCPSAFAAGLVTGVLAMWITVQYV